MRTPFAEPPEIKKSLDTISKKIMRWIFQPIIGIFAIGIMLSFFGAFYAFVFRYFFYLRDGKWSNSLCDLFFDIRIRGGNFINVCDLPLTHINSLNEFLKNTTQNYDASIVLILNGVFLTSILSSIIGIFGIFNRLIHR